MISAMVAMAVLMATASTAAHSQERLVVIVNSDNPVNQLSRGDLEKIYLGKRGFWEWGKAIKTVDLIEPKTKEEDTSRAAFCADYLHKSLAILKSYWVRAIFSGKGQPPLVFPGAGGVINYVGDNVEAIGYVPRRDLTPGKVKALVILEEPEQ
jgi:ABC-type phosphate transport system substrate-binding protein